MSLAHTWRGQHVARLILGDRSAPMEIPGMSLYRNLRLRWKLLSAFAAVCVVMAVVGVVGVVAAQSIKSDLDDMGQDNLPAIVSLGQTESSVLLAQRSIRSAVLVTDPKQIQSFIDAGRQALNDANKAWDAYRAIPSDEAEKALATPVGDALKAYNAFFEKAAADATANTAESDAD